MADLLAQARRSPSRPSPGSGIEVTMTICAHASQEEQRAALRGLGDRLG